MNDETVEFYACIGELKQWVYEHIFLENCKSEGFATNTDLTAGTFDTITYMIEGLARMQYEYDKLYKDNMNLRDNLRDALNKMTENDKPTKKKS